MIISELRLQNFCQHRYRTLQFSPGLNLLVGPNGSGKSNILRALQFALTGDAGGDRNKLDDISQAASADEAAYVEMDMSHAGVDIAVRRSLRPNSNSMTVGGKTYSTATELNKELWTRLGATKKQIVDYVFVGQRKIDEMFDQKPVERAASLAALFGLSHASAVYKQAGEFINSIEVPTTLLDADKLRQQMADLDAAHSHIGGLIQSLRAQRNEVLNALNGDIDIIRAELDAGAPAVAQANKDLAQWQVYHVSALARKKAEDALAALEAAPEVAPTQPTCTDLTPAEETRVAGLRAEHSALRANITHMQTRKENCPTCGQRVVDPIARALQIGKMEEQAEGLKQELDALDARNTQWQQYATARRAYDAWALRVKKAQEALAAFAVCNAPSTNEAALREIVNEAKEYQEAVVTLREQYNNDHAAFLQEERDLQRRQERNRLDHGNAERQLQEFEQVVERTAATRAAKEHLAAVRQVFHHDEAPRLVSYTYVEQMLEEVNDVLEIFDAPYRVVMDENLGFVANFLDGVRRQPDRRLSVGERIVLAMAFRITVNSTFASQVGMLVLDEPTAGLDEHNLGCLPRAIDRLKELSESRGLQVFFVTHEPRITAIFDNVIELPVASL
jgi:DNA repair exonuclease SbcCD ATPase subunit